MNIRILVVLLLLCPFLVYSQYSAKDFGWWNRQHGWENGDPNWKLWMKISPGYLGPNALPVPEVKKGFLPLKTEFELTASAHFMPGDPTQDISGKIYIPFADAKIALEMHGVVAERFAFSEEIRNERFARIEDGKGIEIGDFYFSTLIQLVKDRKFPNTLLRLATKTASGRLEGARYTDSPAYYFDLSFSKDFGTAESGIIRPFGSGGFYTWQTNDDNTLQNDAYMYALGADFIKNKTLLSGSLSGYSGYKNERDRPVQLHFEWRTDWDKKAIRVQYLHGLRDWKYKTIKCSFIWKLNGVK